MLRLSEIIKKTKVRKGEIAVFYLAQAGFCFKNSKNKKVFIDPYLSDVCNRLFGFKRMIPSPIMPEEVDADILVSTHFHADHLDTDAVSVIAKKNRTYFLGSPDCEEVYRKLGISKEKYSIIRKGESKIINNIEFKAVYADHDRLAPDAIGLLIDFDGIKIYNVGDSAYRPEKILKSLAGVAADIMISPINGRFGNMDAAQTCMLGALVKPKILLASHFWMFIEHNGDPAKFLDEAKKLPRGIKPMVMAPGEKLVYSHLTKILGG